MGRWALALVIAMAVLGVAAPAQAQTPLPTISLIDENMCWDDWACGNWLWGVIQPPDARGRPNPFVMYACTITPLVGTDAESCIADLANRTGAASYPVCLWDTGNLPGHFPECPAYSA